MLWTLRASSLRTELIAIDFSLGSIKRYMAFPQKEFLNATEEKNSVKMPDFFYIVYLSLNHHVFVNFSFGEIVFFPTL